MTGIFMLFSQTSGGHETTQKLKYSEFSQAVRNGQVASVQVQGDKISGEFTEEAQTAFENHGSFETIGILNADMQDLLDEQKVSYEFVEEEDDSLWKQLLIYSIPTILLIAVFIFFFRQSQIGGGKAMSFGRSKARMLTPDQHKVTFADIAGIDEAKADLVEIVDFLKNPRKYQRLGGRIPKGVLLMGGPGTGKTLLAKGVAGEAGVPFFSISGSDFVEMFVGVGASRVRDLFEQAKKSGRCIIFIDEIDAVGRYRGAGLGGGHDEREQTLNQLLVEMDGFEANEGIIVMAATNRPDVLDPALLRPGRFDRRVVVPNPDVRGRKSILEVHVKGKMIADDVDLDTIARLTPGASGAELENITNEAALIAASRDAEAIEMKDFIEARDKIAMGRERKSMVISEHEKKTTAYHEAGHALVTLLLGKDDVDPLQKITIVPRGRALGVTYSVPLEDRLCVTKRYAINRIAICMGGRIVEEIIFNQLTTGAGNDLEQATKLAKRMVMEWGMSDVLGPIAFGDQDEQPFLGRELSHSKNYSEHTAQIIDDEVRHFLTEGYEMSRRLITENLDKIELLANALIEFETLDVEDVNVLLESGMDALRESFKKRETAEKPRVAKVAFESKLAEKINSLHKDEPHSDDADGKDDKDGKRDKAWWEEEESYDKTGTDDEKQKDDLPPIELK
ncbi:MAG: ATP-dependent zinc metalloprotease FtsH [Proteobacteria bacterium]|nr:ATP-dependent zinc metalloprotease FtsH [Pseudomonadota bacterium]